MIKITSVILQVIYKSLGQVEVFQNKLNLISTFSGEFENLNIKFLIL